MLFVIDDEKVLKLDIELNFFALKHLSCASLPFFPYLPSPVCRVDLLALELLCFEHEPNLK